MTIKEFVAYYESYLGRFMAVVDSPASSAPWREIAAVLGDRTPEQMKELMNRTADLYRTVDGKFRPSPPALVVWDALRLIRRETSVAQPQDTGDEEFDLSCQPLFDCSTEAPSIRRKVFFDDLPEETIIALRRIRINTSEGRTKPDKAKALRRARWGPDHPTWEDYSEEEQEEHRTAWARESDQELELAQRNKPSETVAQSPHPVEQQEIICTRDNIS